VNKWKNVTINLAGVILPFAVALILLWYLSPADYLGPWQQTCRTAPDGQSFDWSGVLFFCYAFSIFPPATPQVGQIAHNNTDSVFENQYTLSVGH